MGSQFSSDLVDIKFYEVVERHLTKETLASYGIKLWLRYRDDVLCLATSAQQFQRVLVYLRNLANRNWIINLEQ